MALHGKGASAENWRSVVRVPAMTQIFLSKIIISLLLPFLQQKGDVLFQQYNARPHMAAAMRRVLRGVQQLPWPA